MNCVAAVLQKCFIGPIVTFCSAVRSATDRRKVLTRKKICLAVKGLQNCFVNADWERIKDLALAEIEATLAALPEPLRERAQSLPVTFERVPNSGLQADGIEVDTLGLFTGLEFADEGTTVLPSQIILFLENLWDFAAGDRKVFCEEVHTTFLHELGHFLGLGEEDLTERGLD